MKTLNEQNMVMIDDCFSLITEHHDSYVGDPMHSAFIHIHMSIIINYLSLYVYNINVYDY